MDAKAVAGGAPVEPDARVCPDCGSLAGAQPFCATCGRNLSLIERLPTRAEWERDGASATPAPPETVQNDTVVQALGSIGPWTVSLQWADSSAQRDEQLERSVDDHVAEAIKSEGTEELPVQVTSSREADRSVALDASVSLPDGKSVNQRFGAPATGALPQVARVGATCLVGADGEVIREFDAPPVTPTTSDTGDNRGFLIGAYISAVLIPVVGIVVALYTAVSERRTAIRRHAIGIAGISIVSGVLYFVIISAIHSANQDSHVAADLRSLLNDHQIQYQSVGCAHQSGNQYVCTVTRNGQQIPVQVTDDGKSIYEVGIGQ